MKEQVIQAAVEEMKLHALKFTMADMARRLRMSKSSLYKFVASKDELVALVIHFVMDGFDRKAEVILKKEGSTDEKVAALIQAYTETVSAFGSGVCRDLELLYPDLAAEWKTFQRAKVDMCMASFQEGMDRGEYRRVNLTVLRQSLFAALESLGDARFLDEAGLSYSQAIRSLGDILLNGLRRRQEESK